MPTFIVGITENITTRYSVEAPDLQAAEGIAMALFRCGSNEGYLGVTVREEATAWPEEVSAEPGKLECVECGLPTGELQ